MKTSVVCLAATAVVAALIPSAAQSRRQQNVLIGVVGTNNAQLITLTHEDGTPVTALEPGQYTIRISDRSAAHNFVLLGPGIDTQTTTVPEVTETTWTVTLGEGGFAFFCQPHPRTMKGTFVVRTPPPPATTKVVADMHPKSAGAASGLFTGSVATNGLTWRMKVQQLSGRALAAHIHFSNGRIALPLCGPCRARSSGTAPLSARVRQAILGGGAYVNVHTKKVPAGEIRGTLARVP